MVYVVCITAQNNMNSWCERNEEFNIVCLYLKQDKPDKADSLLKVIEQNKIHTSSDTAFYLYNICKGSYYYQKDNYEQAINYLLNAKKITDDNFEILDPEYIEMIAVLSDIFFKDNNGVGTPAYATYLHNRGKLFLDKKQYNESVKYLTESLELQKKQGKILPQTQQYVEEVKQYIK
jgi:tetratricopeptide (TPR) repeat protein